MRGRWADLVAGVALVAVACGSGARSTSDGPSDGGQGAQDGAQDGAPAGAAATCLTLVSVFGGCTTAMLDECAREYATFPAAMQADLDTYAACLRTMVGGLPDAAIEGGTDAGCPTSSNALNRWYFHGGCEGDAAQVNHDIAAFDPCTGTAMSCATVTSDTECAAKYGECTWTAGACVDLSGAPTPCAQAAGACATVPGCTGTGFPSCGGAGQPPCFFSEVIPGSAP
jgi:hypothetical protein